MSGDEEDGQDLAPDAEKREKEEVFQLRIDQKRQYGDVIAHMLYVENSYVVAENDGDSKFMIQEASKAFTLEKKICNV